MEAAPMMAWREGGEVELLPAGVVQERGEHRRWTGHVGDPLTGDELEHRDGVEDGEGESDGSRHEREHPAGLVAEAVEERRGYDVSVVAPAARSAPRRPGIPRSEAPCRRSTPFGVPVVPDVKMTSLTSSGEPAEMEASARADATWSPRPRNASQPGPVRLPGQRQLDDVRQAPAGPVRPRGASPCSRCPGSRRRRRGRAHRSCARCTTPRHPSSGC